MESKFARTLCFTSGQISLVMPNREIIEGRAPKLNYNISVAPQITGQPELNFANYNVYTVSAKSEHKDWAWHFLNETTKTEMIQTYLTEKKLPSGFRSFVQGQKNNPDMAALSQMVLTAKSWYHGNDAQTSELILEEMIDAVVGFRASAEEAIEQAAQMVTQTLR